MPGRILSKAIVDESDDEGVVGEVKQTESKRPQKENKKKTPNPQVQAGANEKSRLKRKSPDTSSTPAKRPEKKAKILKKDQTEDSSDDVGEQSSDSSSNEEESENDLKASHKKSVVSEDVSSEDNSNSSDSGSEENSESEDETGSEENREQTERNVAQTGGNRSDHSSSEDSDSEGSGSGYHSSTAEENTHEDANSVTPTGFHRVRREDHSDSSDSDALSFTDLEGKEVYEIVAPDSMSIESVAEATCQWIANSVTSVPHDGVSYELSNGGVDDEESPHMLIPAEDGSIYRHLSIKSENKLRIQRTLQSLHSISETPEAPAGSQAEEPTVGEVAPRKSREQPKGLRRRYAPPGFEQANQLNISLPETNNEAVNDARSVSSASEKSNEESHQESSSSSGDENSEASSSDNENSEASSSKDASSEASSDKSKSSSSSEDSEDESD